MGSPPIPHYADLFMTKIDKQIRILPKKFNENESEALAMLKRFLDDYILMFVGSTKKLHQLFEEANKINPTIKLTMTHTSIIGEHIDDKCNCEELNSIPFLETKVSIKDGKIDLDLYQKETDRNQ